MCTTCYAATVKSFSPFSSLFLYSVYILELGPDSKLSVSQDCCTSTVFSPSWASPCLGTEQGRTHPSSTSCFCSPFHSCHIPPWAPPPQTAHGSALCGHRAHRVMKILQVLLVPVSLFVTIYCILYCFCYSFANLSEGPKV